MIITSRNCNETRATGSLIGRGVKISSTYGLIGKFGCGKTEFAKGFVSALIPGIVVTSPTFSIVNTYRSKSLVIHHFDFYRIKTISELYEIGFLDYFTDDSICIIEWADLFQDQLPASTIYINFSTEDLEPNIRIIQIERL